MDARRDTDIGVRFDEDRTLAREALRGDPVAVDRFLERMLCVRRFLVQLNVRFGRALGGQELEDVIQDTLFAVWRKLGEFQGRGSLEAWVYRFCYLEMLARLRKLERVPRLIEDVEGALEPRARPAADPLEFERLYRELDRLGPPGSDVIRLKVFEQLTFDEIGRRLEMSSNTAKTRFYRGLSKLRRLLSRGAQTVAGREG